MSGWHISGCLNDETFTNFFISRVSIVVLGLDVLLDSLPIVLFMLFFSTVSLESLSQKNCFASFYFLFKHDLQGLFENQ